MAKKSSNRAGASNLGAGCLALFGLPFFAFGLFALWSLVSMLALAVESSWWVETPATLLAVDLQGNKTSEVTAEYQYTFGGRVYTNDRVGLSEGRDNLGSYQKRMHGRLKKAFTNERTVPCYVNPNDPARALLDRRLRPLMVMVWLPFVFGHGLIGGGLIWFAWKARVEGHRLAERTAAEPEKPWLWREDWAAGKIRSSDAGLISLSIFAVLWNLIAFTVAAAFFGDDADREWWVAFIVLIFPAIGIGLVALVGPQLLTRWRSGPALLRLAKTPGVIGGKLSGVVLVPDWVGRADDAKLTLTCSRTKGTGEDASTYVAWQDERLVTQFLAASEPGRIGVPVDLTIPSDGVVSTDTTNTTDKTTWTLTTEAKAARGRFASTFEVPIFRTEDSQEGITLEDTPTGTFERDIELSELLKQEGIRLEALGSLDSIRYVSPPAQHWGEAIGLTIGGLVFAGVAIGMVWNGWWLGLAFGLFAPFFAYGALDSWLGTSEVTIAGDRWTVQSGWYGFRGAGQRLDRSEILSITAEKSNVQSGNSTKPATKHLIATLDGGKKLILVRSICGTSATRKLLADLEHRAGHE